MSLPAPPSNVDTWKLAPVAIPIELQLPPSPNSIVSSPAPMLITSLFFKWAYTRLSLPAPKSAVRLPLKLTARFTPKLTVSPVDDPLKVILSEPLAPKSFDPLAYIFCVYQITPFPFDITKFSLSPQYAFVRPPSPLFIPRLL